LMLIGTFCTVSSRRVAVTTMFSKVELVSGFGPAVSAAGADANNMRLAVTAHAPVSTKRIANRIPVFIKDSPKFQK
jgi:hypothetical protein